MPLNNLGRIFITLREIFHHRAHLLGFWMQVMCLHQFPEDQTKTDSTLRALLEQLLRQGLLERQG